MDKGDLRTLEVVAAVRILLNTLIQNSEGAFLPLLPLYLLLLFRRTQVPHLFKPLSKLLEALGQIYFLGGILGADLLVGYELLANPSIFILYLF